MSPRDEQVVILCGGMGTRLNSETEFKPKALVDIGGRPILWHLMRSYHHFGFRRFILCLGYRGNMIKDYFLNYRTEDFDFRLDLRNGERTDLFGGDAIEDWEITFAETGRETQTGGRLARVERYIEGDNFLLTYCDGLSDIDLGQLVNFHQDKGKIATLTGFHPRSRYGVVRSDENEIVNYWQEKPLMADLTSGGFFVMNRRVFDYLDTDESCVLETTPLEKLAADGELALNVHDGFWYSMDTYKESLALNEMWNKGNAPWRLWE